MILLQLFLTFLKIGAVSFGGGYGMISLIREECLAHGWLTEEELLNLIGVSESTPGPIAVNLATFIGSGQAGILGALVATLGVVLPAFVIMLLIAALVKNLFRFAGVKATLAGVRPAVVGLVLATAFTMILRAVFGVSSAANTFALDWKAALIFALAAAAMLGWKALRKKPLSPILTIVFCGILGIALYLW